MTNDKYLIEEDVKNPKMVDFKTLSKLGLIYEINRKVLHKYGLALSYDIDSGHSDGCVVADDGKWEYTAPLVARGAKKMKEFKEELKTKTIQQILKEINETSNSN